MVHAAIVLKKDRSIKKLFLLYMYLDKAHRETGRITICYPVLKIGLRHLENI